MDKMSHPAVKERRLQLDSEELCIVRIERRVQIGFNRCQIHAVVFKAGVVTHHQKAERSKQQNGQQIRE